MNVVILAAGKGTSFANAGYSEPKPLIRINGVPMIQRVIECIHLQGQDRLVVAALREHSEEYLRATMRSAGGGVESHLELLAKPTPGPAMTLKLAIERVSRGFWSKGPVVVLDCDTMYRCDLTSLLRSRLPQGSGGVVCFECPISSEQNDIASSLYSFTSFDRDSRVIYDIAEKSRISSYANSGCYVFPSVCALERILSSPDLFPYKCNTPPSPEVYISHLILSVIRSGVCSFLALLISQSDILCAGTPWQLRKCSMDLQGESRKLRICFDIDDTLMSCESIDGMVDYSSPTPIERNVEFLRMLKEAGHYIILQTARRMRTHDGNVGKVLQDVGGVTIRTLEQLNIQYDEIHFGKPYADYYVDDRAISSYADLERTIGIYANRVKERDSNAIKRAPTVRVFEKRGGARCIAAQIYYYKHIPEELSHLFPKFMGSGADGESYRVEEIVGVNMSFSWVHGDIVEGQLLTLMRRLRDLHSFKPGKDEAARLRKRVSEHYRHRMSDRSCGMVPADLEAKLRRGLEAYLDEPTFEVTMIHGDPVFTNVLFTDEWDLKFIDMRGIVGDENTIYGDAMYDFAKVYQSLLGYDEYMHGVHLPHDVRKRFLCVAEDFVSEVYGERGRHAMKVIAYCHIHALLPLHPRVNALNYVKLIDVDDLLAAIDALSDYHIIAPRE